MEFIPYLWLLVGVIFILAEIFTSGFVLLWFGLAALVSGLLAVLHIGLFLQVLVFLLVSGLLTITSRTIFERFFSRTAQGADIRTGIDSLPGQVGTVVEPSTGSMHRAAVQVYGSTWTAYPVAGEDPLMDGEEVQVESIDGSILYVRRVPSQPAWRGNRIDAKS